MSGDGADFGVTADRALETVLGGADQPTEEEMRTPTQMREMLMSAFPLTDIEMRIEESDQKDWPGPVEVLYSKSLGTRINLGYGEAASAAGRAVLEFFDTHPELADTPIENVYPEDWDWADADNEEKRSRIVWGLYEVMKRNGVDLSPLGMSGFMWGWSYNAARYARSEPTAPNPAILEL